LNDPACAGGSILQAPLFYWIYKIYIGEIR